MARRTLRPEDIARFKEIDRQLHSSLRKWVALLSAWTDVAWDIEQQRSLGSWRVIDTNTGNTPNERYHTYGVLLLQIKFGIKMAKVASSQKDVKEAYKLHLRRLEVNDEQG